MLVGQLKHSACATGYPVAIQHLLATLDSLDVRALPAGRHTLPGFDETKAWFVILDYHKAPIDSFLPEVHRHHSDLQIVLEGTEMMAWALDDGTHTHAEPYQAERDLQFYQRQGIELNFLRARPGHFYLFTPETIHITNIDDGDSHPVRKLVVKIHNSLLESTS